MKSTLQETIGLSGDAWLRIDSTSGKIEQNIDGHWQETGWHFNSTTGELEVLLGSVYESAGYAYCEQTGTVSRAPDRSVTKPRSWDFQPFRGWLSNKHNAVLFAGILLVASSFYGFHEHTQDSIPAVPIAMCILAALLAAWLVWRRSSMKAALLFILAMTASRAMWLYPLFHRDPAEPAASTPAIPSKTEDFSGKLYQYVRDQDVVGVEGIIGQGADPNFPNPEGSGKSPLHLAAASGNEKITAILLERGAAINALDAEGDTALHAAVEANSLEVVRMLLYRGADTGIRAKAGQNALDRSLKNIGKSGRDGIFELLLDVMAKNGEMVRVPDEPPAGNEPSQKQAIFSTSPDKIHTVEISDAPAGHRLIIRKQGKAMIDEEAMGYPLKALWSPGGGFLAFNERRGNSGDYLWIFDLQSGKTLKRPDDPAWSKIGGEGSEAIHKTAAAKWGAAISITHGWDTAAGWEKEGVLVVNMSVNFAGPSIPANTDTNVQTDIRIQVGSQGASLLEAPQVARSIQSIAAEIEVIKDRNDIPVWKLHGNAIYTSPNQFAADALGGEPSPDGNYIHFGSQKMTTSSRSPRVFWKQADSLIYLGDVSSRVIKVVNESGILPGNQKLDDQCFVDVTRWIGPAKLLLSASCCQRGQTGFTVSNFPCVWDIEGDNFSYAPDESTVKAEVTFFEDPTPAHESSPVENETFQGEIHPETRTKTLDESDVSGWDRDSIQYAVNEMFARHGLYFKSDENRAAFSRFPWYKPDPALSMDVIEGRFSRIESANLKFLGAIRDRKTAPAADPSTFTGGPMARGETARDSISAFLDAYYKTFVNGSAEKWAGMFTKAPFYCYANSRVSRGKLISESNDLRAKWPTRSITPQAGSFQLSNNGNNATLSFSFPYTYSDTNGKSTSGVSNMKLELVWENDRWLIERFEESVSK